VIWEGARRGTLSVGTLKETIAVLHDAVRTSLVEIDLLRIQHRYLYFESWGSEKAAGDWQENGFGLYQMLGYSTAPRCQLHVGVVICF
jgi:hypothetical protein